jgi:hypothetical protein
MLCQVEDACNNIKGMRNEENRYDSLEYPSKENPGVQIQRVLSRILFKKIKTRPHSLVFYV